MDGSKEHHNECETEQGLSGGYVLEYRAFGDYVEELLDNLIPPVLLEGLNLGVITRPEVRRSDEQGRITMGLYVHNRMGNQVILYYGSFRSMYHGKSEDFWKKKIEETLKHELLHHVEARAGQEDLAKQERYERALRKEQQKYNFQLPVDDMVHELSLFFGTTLVAIYLGGSIVYGDAIPFESDLDCNVILDGDLDQNKKAFVAELIRRLEKKYPFVNGIHINMRTIDNLKEESFVRFILEHNAKVINGYDIAKKMNLELENSIQPNVETALSRLDFAKSAYTDIVDGKQEVSSLERLPDNTYYAARKLARYLVVIEGAYYLMAVGKFRSFDIDQVLRGLRDERLFTEQVLDLTKLIIKHPIETRIGHRKYLDMIQEGVEEMFSRLESMRR